MFYCITTGRILQVQPALAIPYASDYNTDTPTEKERKKDDRERIPIL